ncbi:MAG: hypothetical protein BM564_07855 [Bacteroidetes bacterium MedPE-SWsnd-G2]|nr:MAG: hypothetical protein BM564_07855 [Bacteroidetes bacterium MedPE-SWsnd-G2]
MKNLITTLIFAIGIATSISAKSNHIGHETQYANNYGNSFIFNEGGIEFSIFADGQFDFYIPNSSLTFGYNSPSVNISFNTGFNYNSYVQYDYYGAVIQIQNTPLYYDYYGRVNRIGNIGITYYPNGTIRTIGGLHLFYVNNVYSHHAGFINYYNMHYVYRPRHRYFVKPRYNYCIINPVPYRRHYAPVRHAYHRPYYRNSRPSIRRYSHSNFNEVQHRNQRENYHRNNNLDNRYRVSSTERPSRTVTNTNSLNGNDDRRKQTTYANRSKTVDKKRPNTNLKRTYNKETPNRNLGTVSKNKNKKATFSKNSRNTNTKQKRTRSAI